MNSKQINKWASENMYMCINPSREKNNTLLRKTCFTVQTQSFKKMLSKKLNLCTVEDKLLRTASCVDKVFIIIFHEENI